MFRNLGYSGDEVELNKRLRSMDFGSPDQWLAGSAPVPQPKKLTNLKAVRENRFELTGTKADVIFDPQTAQVALNGAGKWDSIEVAAKPGVSPSDLRDRIQHILPAGFQAKTGTQAAQDSADQIKKGLSFFNIALLVFAGVALFVGAFTIFNTFSILIAQRTRELALLRAIGASPRQVRRSVLGEATIPKGC